ncbi:MAG: hypothetical protein ACI97K_002250 [Glaciecola sp.]|jgi:hypothetical protein
MKGVLPSTIAKPTQMPQPYMIAVFALGVLGLGFRLKKCA